MTILNSLYANELIAQCIAITKAALNTEHPIQRELLLCVLSEKQWELAVILAELDT